MVSETLTASDGRRPHVALLGAVHIDRIAISDGPFRAGCSNPGHVAERFGGAAYNAALALRAFGAGAHLVSACGGDAVAESVGDELERAGIVDDRIGWLDRRSATFTALVDATGDLLGGVADMAIYDRLMPRVLSRRHLKTLFASVDGLVIDANLPAPTLEHLSLMSPKRPVAAIAVSPAKVPRLAAALPNIAMLFASRTEAASLFQIETGADDATIASAVIASRLARAVVTDGPRPVLVVENDRVFRQAPPSVDAIADVVGAGDTLAGAAFCAFLSGAPFIDAVRLGLAAASLRITTGLDAGSVPTARAIADALPAPQTDIA